MTLFRMELGGKNVARLDTADKFDAIVSGCHDNRCIGGIDVVGMNKIKLFITD